MRRRAPAARVQSRHVRGVPRQRAGSYSIGPRGRNAVRVKIFGKIIA